MYRPTLASGAGGAYLTLAAGLRDSQATTAPHADVGDLAEEVPWMTVYFSIGVWTSLAMVVLEWAASGS